MIEGEFCPLNDFSLIFDCAADAVLCVDLQMNISFINRAAEEFTSYTLDQIQGKPCSEVFRSDQCLTACPIQESIRTGHPVTREYEIHTRHHQKRTISAHASPLLSSQGRIIGGVQIFRGFPLQKENSKILGSQYDFHGIVGRSTPMRHLFAALPDIASSEATVLIRGESGTGKELVARAIHDLSPRRHRPLVIVNCGALPETLLESELFGSRRGAYTGSIEDHPGRLEAAQGGTLFLDEIGDMPLPLQVKLLRVLEHHEFQPLGARYPQKADVRFLAATNRDLEILVQEGQFRRDLFFRLNVVSVEIPPLRDRSEDIPLLGSIFREEFNLNFGKSVKGISPDACNIIRRHPFPGNVRELRNLIERTVLLCRGDEIQIDDLPADFVSASREALNHTPRAPRPSKEHLTEILQRHDNKLCNAARELGVDRTTLWRWLKRTGIPTR